jgi:hypothetical protein
MDTLFEPAKVMVKDSDHGNELIEVSTYQEITPEKSQLLRYAYRDGALARNSQAIGKKDSTSVWLSRDLLEHLLSVMDENDSKGESCSLGVLAHWAAYPMDYHEESLAGRHTVVIQTGLKSWIENSIICPPWCGPELTCKPSIDTIHFQTPLDVK